MNKRPFDNELLNKSKEEREKYFNDYTISHPIMKKVLEEVKNEIYNGSQNIIMVVGPSGVGKSRLFHSVAHSIIKDMKDEIEIDKSIIPVAGIELPNPDLGKFNWKDFYYRLLTVLKEPLIDFKADIDKLKNDIRVTEKVSGTGAEMRRSLEKAIFYRKNKAVLIDEAQHFFRINTYKQGEGEINQSQFNSIKSLANMSNTKFVLFGTYNLNAVFNLDGQLSRRVKEIHFPRYDYENPVDIKNFNSIILTFQKLLPIENEPNLLKHSQYLYEYSLGCTGILKNWLQRCLSDALENDEATITLEILERNALKTKKVLTLASEAISGEEDFKENLKDIELLKSLLGTKQETSKKPIQKKGNLKPGVRNPSRDKVGEY